MSVISLNVYVNSNTEEVIIIPFVIDEFGIRRSSSEYIKLENLDSQAELGQKVKEGLEISKQNKPNEDKIDTFKIASGEKSWRSFQQKHQCIVVLLIDNKKYVISAFKRSIKYSYAQTKDDPEDYTMEIEADVSNALLGALVID